MSAPTILLNEKSKGRFDAFSDGVFAIVITLLVLELHVPTGREHLARALGEEWTRYLAYLVSFAFIGGVWVAHSTVSHFVKAVDVTLMRFNLILLLFVSFLPFTTGIAATHLFASFLPVDHVTEPLKDLSSERLAVVLFGANLTLAALMNYLVMRHIDRTDELAADDVVEEQLQGFVRGRRSAVLLQALATVVGVFVPVVAVVVYLGLSIFFFVDPLWIERARRRVSRA
jgi:TMEM175 potassium channel family protein